MPVRGIEAVGEQRGDDAACQEHGDDRERGEVADRHDVGQQDLQPDEAEDQGDRLIDVAEAPNGRSTRARKALRPSSAKALAVQITSGVARHGEGSRDRVDGNAMSARTIEMTTSRSGVPWRPPFSRTNSRVPRNSSVVGMTRRTTSQRTVVGGVGRLSPAAQRAVRDVQEQPTEGEDDRLDGLDQSKPRDDRHASQHERADDADRDHAAA